MGARSEELARQFEQANQEFTDTVAAIPEDEWGNLCPDENWSVGVTAHHVGYDYPILTDTMLALAAGESRPLTGDMIHELNAKHATEHSGCTKQETMQLLQVEGARQAAAIGGLTDEDLDRRHDIPLFGPEPVPLELLITAIMIGHHGMHLPSIRAAAPSARAVGAD
jgi:hypothetical protein